MFNIRKIIVFAIASISLLLVLTADSLVFAQAGATSSTIVGTVYDQQNAVIPGANVVAKNINTNDIREVMSNEDGVYSVQQLRPGQYEVMIKAEGFKPLILRVELDLGVSAKVDVNLKIDIDSQVIEVRGSTLVQEGKTESSINQDKNRIDGLPINRRSFLDFALTSPRVTNNRTPAQGITSASGLSFNGQSGRRNNITIDGVDNNSVGTGSVRATFSQDAVQEFQVLSDSFSAEFGRAIGGVVNIVTKGGANEFHGNAFFIDRNDKISARDAFSPFKPRFSQYQPGITLSGPIKKDKLFFFTSFERLSVKQNNFITISDSTIAAIRNQGFLINNGPVPFSLATTTFLARADLKLTPNDTLYFRYNYGGEYDGNFEPVGGLTAGTSTQVHKVQENAIALNNTYVSAPLNLVNETRFLYSNRSRTAQGVVDGPQSVIVAPDGVVRFGPSPSSTPFFATERAYQFVDNVSLSRGRNQIKAGIDLYYFHTPGRSFSLQPFATPLIPFLSIDFPTITGNNALPVFSAIQAFDPGQRTPQQLAFLMLLTNIAPGMFPGFPANFPFATSPLPSIYQQSFGDGHAKLIEKSFSGFVQDDIKVNPNLLVKLGLRYDINRLAAYPKNNGDFSPRVAFSYTPNKVKNLHAHGAYGIFFAREFVGFSGAVEVTQSQAVKISAFPFPFSALLFSLPGHSIADSSKYPSNFQFVPQLSTVFEYDKNIRSNYAHEVSFGLDYYLNSNTAVSVNYNWVRGLKLFEERNINPVIRPEGNQINAFLRGRVDPTRGDVIQYASNGDSYYHAVTFSAERRFAKNFNFLAAYTISKAIDDFFDVRVDLTNGPVDPFNTRGERGLSTQDVRQRFVFSGVWNLNYSKNIFLRDYVISTIITANAGIPFNLLAGVDLNQTGDAPPSDRPTIGGVSLGRNVGIQPGFAATDLRLTRRIPIKEKYVIEGFVEGFNIFNRTNISQVDNTFSPDAQGKFSLPANTGANGRYKATPDRYRNAFAPRELQFGVRVSF